MLSLADGESNSLIPPAQASQQFTDALRKQAGFIDDQKSAGHEVETFRAARRPRSEQPACWILELNEHGYKTMDGGIAPPTKFIEASIARGLNKVRD